MDINNYIKILTENYQLKLNTIGNFPDVETSYKILNEVLTDITTGNNNDITHNEITDLIVKQYRPTQIAPNTVGSFLFGCFQETHGDVPSRCSPLCAYSIKDKTGINNACENQIWIQNTDDSDFRFIKLSESDSKNAYIFVYPTFMGFNLREIDQFSKNKIKQAQVLFTLNCQHHTIIPMKDLYELPIVNDHEDGLVSISRGSDNYMREFIGDIPEYKNDTLPTYLYFLIPAAVAIFIVFIFRQSQHN